MRFRSAWPGTFVLHPNMIKSVTKKQELWRFVVAESRFSYRLLYIQYALTSCIGVHCLRLSRPVYPFYCSWLKYEPDRWSFAYLNRRRKLTLFMR